MVSTHRWTIAVETPERMSREPVLKIYNEPLAEVEQRGKVRPEKVLERPTL